MNVKIIEIKARCADHAPIQAYLEAHKTRYVGLDHQIDTYFKSPNGRLKLRQGKIEQALIHYHRPNQAGPKLSEVTLYKAPAENSLKEVLKAAMEILVVVDKQRHIYFINNVKFHLDTVQDLGTFMEIEAIDETGTVSEAALLEQCQFYLQQFGIPSENLIERSYSDLLLENEA